MRTSLENASWVDVNTNFTQNNKSDRLADSLAIEEASLYNLFNCMPGQRARTFQPEYGSMWYHFLQEPLLDITAAKMQLFTIEAIERWEPRIILDTALTYIKAELALPGYVVNIAYYLPNETTPKQLQFQVKL
jgi:phage baseplate assembly protein W